MPTQDQVRTLSIRQIAIADAEAAARLSGELGYPVSPAAMEERIRRLAGLADHAVYIACIEDSVVGWIDVGIVHHLQADPYGEIGGLVVSDGHRSAGIGRELVLRAEQFARERGVAKMVVRSQIAREAAHRFYLREGYERTKTSAVFTKALSL
jgi:(aminoalkyl)phosphonate N-acetyltransferase